MVMIISINLRVAVVPSFVDVTGLLSFIESSDFIKQFD